MSSPVPSEYLYRIEARILGTQHIRMRGEKQRVRGEECLTMLTRVTSKRWGWRRPGRRGTMSLMGLRRESRAEPGQSGQDPVHSGSGFWFLMCSETNSIKMCGFPSSSLPSWICDFSTEALGILMGKKWIHSDSVLSDIKLENQKFVFPVRTAHTNRFCLLMGR